MEQDTDRRVAIILEIADAIELLGMMDSPEYAMIRSNIVDQIRRMADAAKTVSK